MSIPSLCKSISSKLSHDLQRADSSEQRHAFAAATLDEMGKRLFPELDKLPVNKAETSDEYRQAREAILELISFAAIPYFRNCTDFRRGITFLEELAGRAGHSQVKRKLVVYANQLKKRWQETRPGAIASSPRFGRSRQQLNISTNLAHALRIALLLLSTIYFFSHIDLTSLIFPRWNETRPTELPQRIPVDRQEDFTQIPLDNIPPQPQANPPQPIDGTFYTYTDEQGVVNFVDNLEKVPRKYRERMKITRPGTPRGTVTPVVINGNQVLVPVTLSFRGRSVETHLLLDTGATNTTISGRLASLLGVERSDVREGRATVADGRSVRSYSFTADSLTVGTRTLSHVQMSVLPGSGGPDHDGLLGMDFLKNFRYHVDFGRRVIEWSR